MSENCGTWNNFVYNTLITAVILLQKTVSKIDVYSFKNLNVKTVVFSCNYCDIKRSTKILN